LFAGCCAQAGRKSESKSKSDDVLIQYCYVGGQWMADKTNARAASGKVTHTFPDDCPSRQQMFLVSPGLANAFQFFPRDDLNFARSKQ
jgi:hypothetical protein